MTTDCRSIIKEFLEEAKSGNIFSSDLGLCSNFHHFCIAYPLSYRELICAMETLRSMMCGFPKYTGDPTYPLVSQGWYDEDSDAMVDFYNPATSSGAIRLEFVEWALEEIAQNRVSYMKS